VRKTLTAVALASGIALVAAGPAGADKEDDQRIADEAAPTLADLPEGWEEEPSNDLGEETGIEQCEGVDRATQAGLRAAYVETPVFVDPDDPSGDTTIEGSLFVFPKVKGAKRHFAAFAADEARDCFQEIGEQSVEAYPSSEVGTADVEVSAGDDAVGYRLELEATDDAGTTDTAVFDFVIVRVGRAELNLSSRSTEDPPPLDGVVDAVVDRLEQEL
jgi:hypothetical protein